MRTFLVAALALVSASAISQQESYTLNGSLKGIKEPVEKIFLSYRANGTTFLDSSTLKNGKYSFAGKVAEPIRASLLAKPYNVDINNWRPKQRDMATVFLSGDKMEATSVDSFSNITVKGSVANAEYAKIQKALKPLNDKASELNTQYMNFDKAKDEAGKNKVMAEFKTLDKESNEVYKDFLRKNPSSPLAMYAINQFAGYDINADEVDPFYAALPASVKNYPSYKDLTERLDVARKIGVGKQAIDFTQNDTLGKPVSLSSFKGKYVLVDFWASWCGPCRRENPNVVSAFNKYKDKGFTVLGVSLDQPNAQAKWMKAIHDDNLTWTHVSDLKFWNNDVAKLYGVRAIPFNLLLDKDGKIIAKNIRGQELQNKLAEIFE